MLITGTIYHSDSGVWQSYPVMSNSVYEMHSNKRLGHTKTVTGEYCSVSIDHCTDHKTFENRSSFFKRIILVNKHSGE